MQKDFSLFLVITWLYLPLCHVSVKRPDHTSGLVLHFAWALAFVQPVAKRATAC